MILDEKTDNIKGAADDRTLFLESLEVILSQQVELCIAARLILDIAERELPSGPLVPALQGIISAVSAAAKKAAEEIEGEFCEEAVKCLHS